MPNRGRTYVEYTPLLAMAVRLKLSDGPDVILDADIGAVRDALRVGLTHNEPIQVETSRGAVVVNPQRVVLLVEESSNSTTVAASVASS